MLYTLTDAFLHYYPHLLLIYVLMKTFPTKVNGTRKILSISGCYLLLIFWDWFGMNAAGRIFAVEVPIIVQEAFDELKYVYGDKTREANSLYASK